MTHPSHALRHSRVPAQRRELDLLALPRVAVGHRARRRVLVVDDGSPARELVAQLAVAVEELGFELVAKDENSGFATTVNVGLRASRSPRAATPSSSTPTSSSTRPAGSTACARAPTPRAARPPSSAPACSTRTACIQHAGVFFSLLHPRLVCTAASTARPTCPRRSIPMLLPGDRRAPAHPPRDARPVGLYDEGYRHGHEDVDYCLRVFRPAASASTSRRVCAIHHESVFRGSPTPRSSAGSASRSSALRDQWGDDGPVPLGPGDAMTELPRTLFMSRGNRRRRLVPLRAPGTGARRRLDRLRRRAAGRPARLRAAPSRTLTLDDVPDVRRRRAPAAARRRVAEARSATGSGAASSSSTRSTTGSRGVRKRKDHDFSRRRSTGRPSRSTSCCMRAVDGIICSTAVARRALRARSTRHLRLPQRHRPRALRPLAARARPRRHRLGRRHRPPPADAAVDRRGRGGHARASRGALHRASVSRSRTWLGRSSAQRASTSRSRPLDIYPAAMTLFDIALAPAGNSDFFHGKSDLRWLEAAPLGMPLHRRSRRLPRHRARRDRLPRLHAGRGGRDPARAGRRRRSASGSAPPLRVRHRASQRAGRPPSSGPRC